MGEAALERPGVVTVEVPAERLVWPRRFGCVLLGF